MGAVVKFKRSGKAAKKKKLRARLTQRLLDELAQEVVAAKAHLRDLQAAAKPSDAASPAPVEPSTASVPLAPGPPSAAELQYDEAWVEFTSAIASMLRTTDPDTIPEAILDTLAIKDIIHRMWNRTRYLLVKMRHRASLPVWGGKTAYYHRVMLRPRSNSVRVHELHRQEPARWIDLDSHDPVWWVFLSSLEQGQLDPRSEDLTFGSLLNLNLLRATHNEEFSGYVPRWEKAVWNLTKAICESWDYDPARKVLSESDA